VRPSSEQQRSLAQVARAYQDQLDEATVSYLAARSISSSAAATFHLGLVREPAPGHDQFVGRLSIPYVTPLGARTIKFRCLAPHDCSEVGCPKYLGIEGSKPRMFNAQALIDGPQVVVICEGELDAIVCSSLLVPAVAIPGVGSWLPHFARMFAGTPRVLIVADNDDPKPRKQCWDEVCQRKGECRGHSPGRELAKRVARDVEHAEVMPPPKGLDLTEWIQAEGLDAVRKGIGL
jgi:hypothetical protein